MRSTFCTGFLRIVDLKEVVINYSKNWALWYKQCLLVFLLCFFVVFFQDLCKWRVWMPSGHQRLRGNWRFLSSFKTKVFKTLQLGKTSQSRDWSTKNTTGRDELYWGTRKLREGREARWSNCQCAPEGRYWFEPWMEGEGDHCFKFLRHGSLLTQCLSSLSYLQIVANLAETVFERVLHYILFHLEAIFWIYFRLRMRRKHNCEFLRVFELFSLCAIFP